MVTHDNIIRIMLCISKGLDLDNIWKFTVESAGFVEFLWDGKLSWKENSDGHLKQYRSDLSRHAL